MRGPTPKELTRVHLNGALIEFVVGKRHEQIPLVIAGELLTPDNFLFPDHRRTQVFPSVESVMVGAQPLAAANLLESHCGYLLTYPELCEVRSILESLS
jgi:hypothetical protein